MEWTITKYILEQWVAIAILSIGWYFLVKYFMGELAKKDQQNQDNLDRYIVLSENTIVLMEKTSEIVSKFWHTLDWLHPKLDAIHNDIKEALVKIR
jgi:hypothetical protein